MVPLAGLSGEFNNWMGIEADRLSAAHRIIEHAPDLERVPSDLIAHQRDQAIVRERQLDKSARPAIEPTAARCGG
jgi:hypothetical protein